MKEISLIIITISLFYNTSIAQQLTKDITTQTQYWFSINTVSQISKKWAIVADYHERREENFRTVNFQFIRGGMLCFIDDNFTMSGGYSHLWTNTSTSNGLILSQQNRIYQQFCWRQSIGDLNFAYRIRNEQRWQQNIDANGNRGSTVFNNRLRFLFAMTLPIFKNKKLPQITMSDELMAQFGKDIIYNTFDQNRLFIGIRQNITKDISFDTGYMMVYQQKSSGYQYDINNTIRLFIYYKPNFTKHKTKINRNIDIPGDE